MSLGSLLLVILMLMLVGAIPSWPHSRSWGLRPEQWFGGSGDGINSPAVTRTDLTLRRPTMPHCQWASRGLDLSGNCDLA
jgi:hypothetical protein